jgi:dolichol-phosphate mannosyltransferase
MSAVLTFFRSLIAFSATPLTLISVAGFVMSLFSIIALVIYSIIWIFIGVPFAGFGTIISIFLVLFSTLTVIVSLIGEYIGLIYEEVKMRPKFIVESTIGL